MTQTAPRITSTVETITPDLARAWLVYNEMNRNARPRVVAAYARDMRAGDWTLTGEAIKFDYNGKLLDGQHRLRAVIEADVAVDMLVIRGLDPEARVSMDSGAKRKASDLLTMQGERNGKTLSALAVMAARGHDDRARRAVTTAEQLALIEEDPSIRAIACDVAPHLRINGLPQSLLAYTYWVLDKVDSAEAARFFDSLHNLVGLPEGSPIIALNRWLTSSTVETRSSHTQRFAVIAAVFIAWNAWRRGEKRRLIKPTVVDGRLNIPKPI